MAPEPTINTLASYNLLSNYLPIIFIIPSVLLLEHFLFYIKDVHYS